MSETFSTSSSWDNPEEDDGIEKCQPSEQIEKLKRKIEGYRTVAEKLPKYFGIIKELQLKKADQEKIIGQLKVAGTEKDQLIHRLQQQNLLNERRGSVELLSGSSLTGGFSVVTIGCDKHMLPSKEKLYQQLGLDNKQPQKAEVASFENQQLVNSAFLQVKAPPVSEWNPESIVISDWEKKKKTVTGAVENLDKTLWSDVSRSDSTIFPSGLTYTCLGKQRVSTQMSFKPYGEGARPKEGYPWNKLSDRSFEANDDENQMNREDLLVTFSGMEDTEVVNCAGQTSHPQEQLSCNLSAKEDDRDILLTQTPVDLTGQNDLIKFSHNSSTVKYKWSDLVPNNEETQLASRAESMATFLKSQDSTTAISEMLFKFAEDAKNMAAKLKDYQAQNERQQIQIQSLSKEGSSMEIQKLRGEISFLREENETLLETLRVKNQTPLTASGPKNEVTTRELPGAHYPDSPLMKKLESLEKINARLFRANKDWHNKWEILHSQAQGEQEALEGEVTSLTSALARSKDAAAKLEMQLQEANVTKHEMETENQQYKNLAQRLKSQVSKLAQEKERLESDVAALKTASKQKSKEMSGSKNQETEIGLLKQQLTIFVEDFEREKKDRIATEHKIQKIKKEKDQLKLSMETTFNKLNVQLRMQEDDLRMKARQTAELQYQVDNLKLELQREQRKSTLTAKHERPGPPDVFHNEENSCSSISHSYSQQAHSGSPEHLPGAWKCFTCTYINFPSSTVCDICGQKNTNQHRSAVQESLYDQQKLQSRGDKGKAGRHDPDVVIDSL